MHALNWLLQNFGIFFAAVFLFYTFMVIHTLVQFYDHLRSPGDAPAFLQPLFVRLQCARRSADCVIDAIWAEFDSRVTSCQTTLNGQVSALVLVGFAGTICGSIGAFREMFKGLASGQGATEAFLASWNTGLSTALYTSLGAAVIGAVIMTLVCSRWMQRRVKHLEARVALTIADILDEGGA